MRTRRKALRDAGWDFEIEPVKGYRLMPWTRRGQRDEIREISGQENVPVLVTDGGDVVSGSGAISRWASAQPGGAASLRAADVGREAAVAHERREPRVGDVRARARAVDEAVAVQRLGVDQEDRDAVRATARRARADLRA